MSAMSPCWAAWMAVSPSAPSSSPASIASSEAPATRRSPSSPTFNAASRANTLDTAASETGSKRRSALSCSVPSAAAAARRASASAHSAYAMSSPSRSRTCWFRVSRPSRNQHVLLRLGELIAYAECADALARRAAAAADGTLHDKADRRFDPVSLAAVSRVFARDAALKVGEEGLRLVAGASDEAIDAGELEGALGLTAIHAAQHGLIADMGVVRDALYAAVG